MTNLETYLITSFANNRSNKRTDVLNEVLLEEFLSDHPQHKDLNWVFEHKVRDGYGATFKVDCAGLNEKGEPVIVLLNKNANSNFAQNLKNYANTTVGEAARVLLGPDAETVEQVFFITVHPNVSPFFKRGGEVGRLENNAKAKQRTNVAPVVKALFPGKVSLITITFDIGEVREFTHKSQFEAGITVQNVQKTTV